MVFQRTLFGKVAILGTGLIGGSVALAMKKKKLANQIVGFSQQESSLKTAMSMGAIDHKTRDVIKAIQGADLIILAAPVHVILEHIEVIAKHLKRGAIVTDVGSSKVAIVDAVEKFFPQHALFVGSHPIAGSEKSGIKYADANLFQGATCLMTPVEKTNPLARDKVKHLWEQLGMNVRLMGALEHDEVMAFVSHLPHIVAFSLMSSIPADFFCFAAAGLKDTVRIAGSSPKVWADISLSNYRNVIKAIDEMVKNLAEVRKAIVEKDDLVLTQVLQQAKTKHEGLEKEDGQ